MFVTHAHEVALYQYERPIPIIKRDIPLLVAKTGEMTQDLTIKPIFSYFSDRNPNPTLLVFVTHAHEVALYQYERPIPIIKRDIPLLVLSLIHI